MVILVVINGLRLDSSSVTLGENDIDSNSTGDYRPNRYEFTGEVRTDWVESTTGSTLLATFYFPDTRSYDSVNKKTTIPFILTDTETAKIDYLPRKKDPNATPKPKTNAHVFEIRAKNLETGFTYSVVKGFIETDVSGVASGD